MPRHIRCDDREPHGGHVWTYERIIQDMAASLRAGEPVGREVITDEWCPGRGPGSCTCRVCTPR